MLCGRGLDSLTGHTLQDEFILEEARANVQDFLLIGLRANDCSQMQLQVS